MSVSQEGLLRSREDCSGQIRHLERSVGSVVEVMEEMMRKLDCTERQGTSANVQTTPTMSELRRLQAQRGHEHVVWQAELQKKDRQITALKEEQERLLLLLWGERERYRSERKDVDRDRETERAVWRERMSDRERHILTTVLAVTEMKLTLNWSAGPEVQQVNTETVYREFQRNCTEQETKGQPMPRKLERGCNSGGQKWTHDTSSRTTSTSTLTPAMVTDTVKADEQEALRALLLEKDRRQRRGTKAAEQTGHGEGVNARAGAERRFWSPLRGFSWFGITRKSTSHGRVSGARESSARMYV
ncbi:uncharacterized protein LOC134082029 [Sardina pilchardus]|uniref:uncharacterized protein LOC134082029 n=1 Tax=Sardina pilchardus TaxID=27697 RepID=UPI002E15EE0A